MKGIYPIGRLESASGFPSRHGRVRLIRNHEVGEGPDAFAPGIAYDPEAGAGTVTLEFDTLRGECVSSWSSISGTVRNCAGGPTPWGSWLTCEETTIGIGTARVLQAGRRVASLGARPPSLHFGPTATLSRLRPSGVRW